MFEMDKYKAIAEKITYLLDGYIADHNNRNFGDADLWLRHVRNRWEQFIEAHPDSYNFHEYLQHQQAKVGELEKHIVDLEQQMLRDSALATKAQMERNALQKKLQSTKESAYKAGFYDGRNGTPCEYVRLEAERDELQKRMDKAIRLLVEAELYQSEPNIDLAVKALKGEGQ